MEFIKDQSMKKKFVSLVPLSSAAKFRFATEMDHFHACMVLGETDDMFDLVSLNGQYLTKVPKKGNSHWQVVK